MERHVHLYIIRCSPPLPPRYKNNNKKQLNTNNYGRKSKDSALRGRREPRRLLCEYLIAKGYDATLCPDGEAGFREFQKEKFDICILDVMMPKKDGFTLAQDIRQMNSQVPIIFLTARVQKEDVLEGFDKGADDYITKPFSMEELVKRVEAILRRVRGKKNRESTMYKIGRFTFDTQKQLLTIDGKSTKAHHQGERTPGSALLSCQRDPQTQRRSAHDLDRRQLLQRTLHGRVHHQATQASENFDDQIEIINIHGQGYKAHRPGGGLIENISLWQVPFKKDWQALTPSCLSWKA